DEITLTGSTIVHEIVDGSTRVYDLTPADLGLPERSPDELRGGDPATNAELARAVLDGQPGAVRDIVVANAAAGLWVGDAVDSLAEGVELAAAAIDDGRARATLDALIRATNELARPADEG